MKKKLLKTIFLLFILSIFSSFLSGCWDEVEIEDRALVLGLSIDEAPPGSAGNEDKVTHTSDKNIPAKMISVTAQIAVPGRVPLGPGSSSEGGAKSSPIWAVKVVGHSLDDAMNNLQQQISDPRYLIHLRVIIISEAIARGGLDELNDYLRRNPEVRRRTWLLVSEGSASKFMDVEPPLQRVPTLYILAMMEKAVSNGILPADYIGVYWSADSKWGQNAYLPHVAIRNQENILIDGLAYFSKGKLIAKTLPIEIGLFMAIQGVNPGGYTGLFRIPDLGIVMTKINERHTRRTSSIEHGLPHLSYHIRLEGDLDEHYDSNKSINSSSKLEEIEASFEQQIQKSMMHLIQQTQSDHSDIFGMGEMIRAHHPSYWKQNIHNKNDWADLYSDAKIDIKVIMRLRRIGLKER